jgi:hypothetical protein
MTTGADVVDQIGTTTTMWDLRGDGIPDLSTASLMRKTTTIYEIGAERNAECDVYDELPTTVHIALDLIARRVVEHLGGGGGGNTGGYAWSDGAETAGRSNNNNDDNDDSFNDG